MHRLSHAVDVLLFNPPYVPTYADEADDAQHDAGIAGAWAGGADGMQITNTVLQQVEVPISLLCLTRYKLTKVCRACYRRQVGFTLWL